MTSLLTSDCRIKVSSVLNRETTLYGKQFLTDGNEETCWNSDSGTPQFIVVDFGRSVLINTIQLMFQGGFVGKSCLVQTWQPDSGDWADMTRFYPEDINPLQTFPIVVDAPSTAATTSRIKIVFETSTDFFGRITVYKLDILGQEA
ncbi:Nuclear receptor 2C2-associated protein [Actinomortierella ambigua]|uniref:Nuclear receptor 2C2-associated protein n=1 Tax=Actinomortierella ambigua TaxID=1343610 RepID=A0A9P6QA69_9FUNG|nr:Nuclear receptor 2C2-associated protein [Actinomortierella ambigua]